MADRVFIRSREETKETRGGLFIPETAKESRSAARSSLSAPRSRSMASSA
jgi:co-chaperonin GroES (HSP10)